MSENYTLINWQNGEVTQPAVVEIDGVDYQVQPAIETGNTPINADNLNHMDAGIRNATLKLNNKIETATVKLIAVSETAPEHCSEGDKYYNTSTNLIYTATGTDTWGVTGEQPNTLYVYMDTNEQKLYYYDGNTFSSYGGGSGDGGKEVFIQSTEPTEETAELWIDTDELLPEESVVVNSLEGNETTKAPSVNAVKNRFKYSTDEIVIGEWIDGKPLYRKVLSQNNKAEIDINSLDYDYLAIVYSRITIASSPHPYIRYPYYTSSNDYFRILTVPSGALQIETSHSSISNWTTVLEYTKTTD